MLQSIDNMRTLAQLCRSHEPLPDALASWLAASLQAFLDHSTSLNEAFGIHNGRGGIPWRVAASIRQRDAALRHLAVSHFSRLSVSGQARRIHQLSLRYAATAWRFDREREEMPAAYCDMPQEFLWQAFKSGATMPVCARHLRTILGV